MRSILAYIGPEAALLEERPGDSGAGPTAGSGGPQGSDGRSRGRCRLTTHSTPLQGVTGPASLSVLRLVSGPGGWVVHRYSPSQYPPSHTTPVPHPLVMHTDQPCQGHQEHVHMTVSRTSKENLGYKNTAVIWVPDGLLRFKRFYTAV